MKKLIALMFAVLFLGAGIATASDLTMTGKYYVRGSYYDNVEYDYNPAHDHSYGFYDHELSVDTKWKMDDTTFVIARFEIRDANWGTPHSATEGTTLGGATTNAALELDDNIIAEQVWGQTTFANGMTLQVGLMPAGAWGSNFGNTETEAYRIKALIPTTIGTFVPILEKSNTTTAENGNPTYGDDNDTDSYILGYITKIGPVNVKPLFVFVDSQNVAPSSTTDFQVLSAQLSIDGKIDMLGFEMDAIYKDYDYSSAAGTDYDIFGIYGDVWYQMQALKLGAFAAYGSWDEEAQKGFDMGDDFYPGNLLILGDDFLGDSGTAANSGELGDGCGGVSMGAGTLFGVYGSYAVTDKLSLSAVAAFATIDRDRSTTAAHWDDADIFELSGGFAYKITPSLTYDGGIGMAEVDFGNATPDPDTIVEAFHRLSFAF